MTSVELRLEPALRSVPIGYGDGWSVTTVKHDARAVTWITTSSEPALAPPSFMRPPQAAGDVEVLSGPRRDACADGGGDKRRERNSTREIHTELSSQ